PATLGDDDAPALQLSAQAQIVVVGRSHCRQRLVQMLIPQISDERAVDILFLGIYVPGLSDRARIDLSSEKVLTERSVGGRENEIGGRKLLGSRFICLLQRSDCACQCADWIVVESHPVGVGRENS